MMDALPFHLKQTTTEFEPDGSPIRQASEDRSEYDAEVQDSYLFEADSELMSEYSPIVRRTMSITNANETQLKKHRIQMAIKRFGRFEGDTGSPACTGEFLLLSVVLLNN